MKMTHCLLTVVFLLVLVYSPGPSAGQATAIVAFEDVTVIPMDGERSLPKQTVIVRDGRIAELASVDRLKLPSGAMRVDGRGKFLIPALAEMHAHIPGVANTSKIAGVMINGRWMPKSEIERRLNDR